MKKGIKLNKKNIIMGAITLLVIVVVIIGFALPGKSKKKDNKDKKPQEQSEQVNNIEFNNSVPETEKPSNTDDGFFTERDDKQQYIYDEQGKTHKVNEINTSTLEKYTTLGGPYETDTLYQNNSCGFSTVVPKGYSTVEQANNILCIRDNESNTQVAIIHLSGTYSDAITVWETSYNDVYSITALLTDEEGVTEEKTVKNYGSRNKSDVTVGNFAVKEEIGEVWFRNTGEHKDVILDACSYFTTLPDKNGLVLVGTSQTKSYTEVFDLMDTILASITLVDETIDISYEMTRFESGDGCDIQFDYPKSWEVSTNTDGMTIIKAPNSQQDPCCNMVVEYFADKNKSYVTDHAQFTAAYEKQLVAPAFLNKVELKEFDTSTTVSKLDINAKIGEKDAYYSEEKDIITCYTQNALDSLPSKDDYICSRRYSFTSAGVPCVINFIIPKDNQNCINMMDSIMASLSAN